jgi:hypothetical protein
MSFDFLVFGKDETVGQKCIFPGIINANAFAGKDFILIHKDIIVFKPNGFV